MTDNQRAYYEAYWSGEGGQAAAGDPLTPRRLRFFSSVVPPGELVLDAGCGACGTTQALRAAGYRAVGIELSLRALRDATEPTLPRAQAQLDGPLPFRASTFGAVYCAEVLEHLMSPRVALSELYRVLRPGGLIVTSVPFHGTLKNVALAMAGFERHFDPDGQHIRFFTQKSFRASLIAAGFRVDRLVPMGRFWPFYMNMVAVGEKPL